MNTVELTEARPLAVYGETVIHLPLGLLGFERIKKYVLLADPGEAPFQWLQVLDDPGLAFLVVSPFEVRPDYQPEISPEDVEFLELVSPADALLLNIVTLRTNDRAPVNLKGPIVANRRTLRARQVVLANAADFALQHPLPAAE